MSTPQLTYQKPFPIGRPGQIAFENLRRVMLSVFATVDLPFGRFACQAALPIAKDSKNLVPVKLPTVATDITGPGGLGVITATQAIESPAITATDDPGYDAGRQANLMRHGGVVIETEVAVKRTDAVFVRFSASGAKNEVQTMTPAEAPTAGTFRLRIFLNETTPILWNASTSDIAAAIAALPEIGSGNVGVSGTWGTAFVITFQSALAATNIELLEVIENNLRAGVTQNEEQTATPSAPPTSGDVTFTNGVTESAVIHFGDTAPAIQTALETTYGAGNVAVTGTLATAIAITFQGSLAGTPVPVIQLGGTNTLLATATPVTFTFARVQEGATAGHVGLTLVETVQGTAGAGGLGGFRNDADSVSCAQLPKAVFARDSVYDKRYDRHLTVLMVNN